MWQAHQWSLANRQLVLLATSMSIVAVLLGLGGAWYIRGFAERTSDRVLRASVNSIVETIAMENGKVTLEVPPGAFGMLEDAARDNVYYAIRSGSTVITGYADFPKRASTLELVPGQTTFRYDEYLGQDVRVATQARYLPRMAEPVIVEVAETLDERRALTNAMLLRLAVLEALMIILVALLIKPAIRWGLLPLTRLQREIADRGPGKPANSPITLEDVPAELRGLVSTFNLLLSRLDEAIKRVRDFTGDASHQMRTPLAALRTHLLVAKRHGSDSAERQAALIEVEAASRRLQRLLSQLLALARSDDALAARPAGYKTFDLSQQVREVAAELAPKAIAAGLEYHVDADLPMNISANPLIVAEIVTNITDNAIRYSRGGEAIWIRASVRGGEAVVEIEDSGPGIPADERDAVFRRFYRLKRDSDKEGSGLGLAIVRSLAEASGATLRLADGRSGKGLLVIVGFPLKTPHERLAKVRFDTSAGNYNDNGC